MNKSQSNLTYAVVFVVAVLFFMAFRDGFDSRFAIRMGVTIFFYVLLMILLGRTSTSGKR